MQERISEKIDKSERIYAQELDDVTRYLQHEQKNIGVQGIEQSPRECSLKRTVTPDKLKSLLGLKLEVIISDHKNGLSLYTGQRNAAEPLDLQRNDGKSFDVDAKRRTDMQARFTLHNHPAFTGSPSSSDFHASWASVSEVEFIVGTDGIICHKSKNVFDATAVDFHVTRDLRRKFFPKNVIRQDIKKKRIIDIIRWGDPRMQIICDYINDSSGKPWDEYQKKLLA